MNNNKYCELDPNKLCDNCNKCNLCDINPNKICNSCGECLNLDSMDYKEVIIEGVLDQDDKDDYIYDENTIIDKDDEFTSEDGVVFIEDVPGLKEKYQEKIDSLQKGSEVECNCHHEE